MKNLLFLIVMLFIFGCATPDNNEKDKEVITIYEKIPTKIYVDKVFYLDR